MGGEVAGGIEEYAGIAQFRRAAPDIMGNRVGRQAAEFGNDRETLLAEPVQTAAPDRKERIRVFIPIPERTEKLALSQGADDVKIVQQPGGFPSAARKNP